MILPDQIKSALENIYISPLELCNLNCRLCYTNKTKNILTNRRILSFIRRYQKSLSKFEETFFSNFQRGHTLTVRKKRFENLRLKSILFCGGEVFTLSNFPRLINNLQKKGIFISIITNGTIDKLDKIHDPANCQLLVSLDGPEIVHDQNRGVGNFNKSISFIKHALSLGFPVEIMFLITPASYPYRNSFPRSIAKQTGRKIKCNYITQKSIFYTDNHPLSNQNNRQPALTADQIIDIKRRYPSIPAKNFGCFQLSLQSDSNLYGCCESPIPIGSLSGQIKKTITAFTKSLQPCFNCQSNQVLPCAGCCAPDFLCGYKKELRLASCLDVVNSFR